MGKALSIVYRVMATRLIRRAGFSREIRPLFASHQESATPRACWHWSFLLVPR